MRAKCREIAGRVSAGSRGAYPSGPVNFYVEPIPTREGSQLGSNSFDAGSQPMETNRMQSDIRLLMFDEAPQQE